MDSVEMMDFTFLIGHDIAGKYDVFDMDRNKLGGPFNSAEEADQFCKETIKKRIDELRTQGLYVVEGETVDTTIYEDDKPISINEAVQLATALENNKTVH